MEPLAGISTLALDSAPLIYYIEEEPRYLPLLIPIIDAIDASKIICYASTIALLEVLVKPLRERNEVLAREYHEILLHSRLHLIAVNATIAQEAARLRAQYRLKTPDALHIATALVQKADALLTKRAQVEACEGGFYSCVRRAYLTKGGAPCADGAFSGSFSFSLVFT